MRIYIICKIVHVCEDLGIVVRGGEGVEQRGKADIPLQRGKRGKSQARIQRGGGGGQGGPDPPCVEKVVKAHEQNGKGIHSAAAWKKKT